MRLLGLQIVVQRALDSWQVRHTTTTHQSLDGLCILWALPHCGTLSYVPQRRGCVTYSWRGEQCFIDTVNLQQACAVWVYLQARAASKRG